MINKFSPTPIHIQLYEILKQDLENGEYAPHQLLPSENELCRHYDISRTTVRAVIQRLTNEQLVYRVPGKGTFVSESKITTQTISQRGIREQLEEMGYETDTEMIEKGVIKATRHLAEKLRIPEDDLVYKIKRLRFVNNTPFSIHTNYLSAKKFPDLLKRNVEELPLCNILEEDFSTEARYGEETLESVTASSAESKFLEVPSGFHVLMTECVLYDDHDEPIECSKVVFRGDRIKLRFKFDRT